jgi:hypothetical protein
MKSFFLHRIIHTIISNTPDIANNIAVEVKPATALTINDATGMAATQTAPNKAELRARYSSLTFLINSTLHRLVKRDIEAPTIKATTAIIIYIRIADLIKRPVSRNEK